MPFHATSATLHPKIDHIFEVKHDKNFFLKYCGHVDVQKRLCHESEGGAYRFRKVKWGYSKERVELAEAGNTVFERGENAIVYK